MKLRNKMTDEIGELTAYYPSKEMFAIKSNDKTIYYFSLADLCNEWEDYTLTEPLIKDEKIRKAVRAWAEVNDFEEEYVVKYYLSSCSLNSWQADIEFNTHIEGLKDGEEYTIAELCGEEEE